MQWLQIVVATRRLRQLPANERQQAHQALAALLANSRGMTMKIGQLMATGVADDPYQSLISSITPLPLVQILPTLTAQLQQPIAEIFKEIKESQAAASLGQVHYAVLQDGSAVAIKIRYPGIVDTVTAELKLTDWLPSAGPFKRWQFDTDDYKQTLRQQLLRETDYRIEAQTQQRFKDNLSVEGLCISKVYPQLTCAGVLVQAWETGQRLQQVVNWNKKQRLQIAKTLLVTLFQSLFVQGEIHGDPHSGNYLFRLDAQGNAVTVLLDFGCTVLVTKPRRLALLKLIDAYMQGTQINPLQCFAAMGFNPEKLNHIGDKLPILCQILFLPFTQPRAFELEQWQLGSQLQQLLAEQRWWFRAAGPADLILLLRAFHGLIQQLNTLQVALPWGALLKYSVSAEVLEEARNLVLPELGQNFAKPQRVLMTARKLSVRVYEQEVETISLDLPAEAALELDALIPAAVLAEIKTSVELDLLKLTADLQQHGLYPQLLFETDNGLKRCRVWLE